MNPASEHVYTPSELNREIKLHLETGFPRVLLEAEISNLVRPASGHLYFSLKDQKAQIRCAMFRSSASRLTIRPDNGLHVLARGRISLYEPRGDYQFIVEGMQDAGEGMLQRQFEELKKKLAAEGLFDARHRKPIPPYPARIALITSASGAAVRDLLQVLARRWPVAQVRLYPVLVQGEEAPAEIRRALEAANHQRWADTIILGRGGGSLEDLAAFNDEILARTVFASDIPLICAVGHETDFSICDFVADLRAPTPSAAAELATPDQAVLKQAYSRLQRQLQRRIIDRFQRETQRLDHAAHRLQRQHPSTRLGERQKQLNTLHSALRRGVGLRLQACRFRLDPLASRLIARQPGRQVAELRNRVATARDSIGRLVQQDLDARRNALGNLARTLNAVSPLVVLARGYAVITAETTGEVISNTAQVTRGDRIFAQLKDGTLTAKVESTRKSQAD